MDLAGRQVALFLNSQRRRNHNTDSTRQPEPLHIESSEPSKELKTIEIDDQITNHLNQADLTASNEQLNYYEARPKPRRNRIGGRSEANHRFLRKQNNASLVETINRISVKTGLKQSETNKFIAYSIYAPRDPQTIESALLSAVNQTASSSTLSHAPSVKDKMNRSNQDLHLPGIKTTSKSIARFKSKKYLNFQDEQLQEKIEKVLVPGPLSNKLGSPSHPRKMKRYIVEQDQSQGRNLGSSVVSSVHDYYQDINRSSIDHRMKNSESVTKPSKQFDSIDSSKGRPVRNTKNSVDFSSVQSIQSTDSKFVQAPAHYENRPYINQNKVKNYQTLNIHKKWIKEEPEGTGTANPLLSSVREGAFVTVEHEPSMPIDMGAGSIHNSTTEEIGGGVIEEASKHLANKKLVLKSLNLKQVIKSKRERDNLALQMHNRLLYLQNEELKKLKKLDMSRKKAQLLFENQVENRRIKIQLENQRAKLAKDKEDLAHKIKEQKEEHTKQKQEQCLKEKQQQAAQLRKEKRKIEKIKFKQEVNHVRRNMEKRDEIFRHSPRNRDSLGRATQLYKRSPREFEKTEKVEKHIKKIKNVEREIKKLMGLESQFLERLRLTISKEAGLWKDIDQLSSLKNQIQDINDVEALEKFLIDNPVVRNLRASSNLNSDRQFRNPPSPKVYEAKKGRSKTNLLTRNVSPKRQSAEKRSSQSGDEDLDTERKKIAKKQLMVLTPKDSISKKHNLLTAFQQRIKQEMDKKIDEAKKAWAKLDADRLTDGNSNSQAGIEYSQSIKTFHSGMEDLTKSKTNLKQAKPSPKKVEPGEPLRVKKQESKLPAVRPAQPKEQKQIRVSKLQPERAGSKSITKMMEESALRKKRASTLSQASLTTLQKPKEETKENSKQLNNSSLPRKESEMLASAGSVKEEKTKSEAKSPPIVGEIPKSNLTSFDGKAQPSNKASIKTTTRTSQIADKPDKLSKQESNATIQEKAPSSKKPGNDLSIVSNGSVSVPTRDEPLLVQLAKDESIQQIDEDQICSDKE